MSSCPCKTSHGHTQKTHTTMIPFINTIQLNDKSHTETMCTITDFTQLLLPVISRVRSEEEETVLLKSHQLNTEE